MHWTLLIIAWLLSVLCWLQNGIHSSAAQPGYLDFDNLPDTNFSCDGKVIGGYYADVETGCQMFHVCTIGQKAEITDIKFLCLNGTVFDQETRVCERLDEVDCSKSESFFGLNLELYGNGAAVGIQPEGEEEVEEGEEGEELVDEDTECDPDVEDCKTETLLKHEQELSSQELPEVEEEHVTTTHAPFTTTTTTTPQPTTVVPQTTSHSPHVIQYTSSSPETIAALLALHNAFQQSLQQHEPQKTKQHLPRPTNNFPPSTANINGHEQKNRPFAPTTTHQTSFTRLRPSEFVQRFPQHSSNVQTHHFPVQKFESSQNFDTHPTFPNTHFQSTSEQYGNTNFHHGFHIPQRFQYSDYREPTTTIAPERSKPFDFHFGGDFSIEPKHQEPVSSQYLLHQLKVDRLTNQNKPVHGGFARAIPEKPRILTTPAIAVVTSTSTTTSVRTSKPNSAINLKQETNHFTHPTNPGSFVTTIVHSNGTEQGLPHSYDEYQDGDVHADPFFKDVPKIGRSKRYTKVRVKRRICCL